MVSGEGVARFGVTVLLLSYFVYRVVVAVEKLQAKQTSNAYSTEFKSHLVYELVCLIVVIVIYARSLFPP